MTHTVIGFFRNSSDAFNAADELREKGFGIDNVDVMTNTSDKDIRRDDEKSSKIGNFFKSLFSDNDEEADRYSDFAGKNSMITVHAADSAEAERAADILDSYGAIDIDDGGVDFRTSGEYTGSDYGSARRDLEESDFNPDRPQKNYHRSMDVNDEADNDAFSETDMDEVEPDLSYTGDPDDVRRRYTSEVDNDVTSEASIPVIEEDVSIGKREVSRGGVRVRSRIISRPVEETVRLREEHVTVERTPADRDATDADITNMGDETIEVHAYGEEPVVSKRAKVVEEVKVGKKVHERDETIRERARKTEIDVDNIGDEDITDTDITDSDKI